MSKFCLRGRSGGDGPYLAQIKGKILKFNTLPRLTTPATLDWIDDKSAMRRKFSAAGFPIARGGIAFSYKKTLQLFRTIKGTVIIKPRTGSRSRHTTIAITTEKELYQAFQNAKQLSPWVIVEEQLRGWVFRVTLINRKVCAVMRREPPHVVGNGIKTIQELIDEENLLPARQGPVFHQIPITTETHAELERQNLTLESIPESGRVVTLHQKVGRSSGASTTDVTAQVHPENIQLFEKIAHFLDDSLVGIDMIIEDMSKPWYEQMPSGIIECNSLPFIDLHHFPLRGEVQNVAGALWDYVEQTI
jgi:cyanophycin synthetase